MAWSVFFLVSKIKFQDFFYVDIIETKFCQSAAKNDTTTTTLSTEKAGADNEIVVFHVFWRVSILQTPFKWRKRLTQRLLQKL